MNMHDVRARPARGAQPLIRLNDFGVVTPPALGAWTPSRTVSVVVPVHRGRTLALTLASLAAQSYPSHLMEVVVVDDGAEPPLRLPEIVPERTRVVRSRPGGWGRAWACQSGADVAEGEVIHWLDADMVLFREQVEAQMRWHHLADYLTVLGTLKMVAAWDAGLTPAEVHAAVSAGTTEKLFEDALGDGEGNVTDTWSSEYIGRTAGLREAGFEAFKVHVGASASLPASLLRRAGGMDTSLVLAEDTELGYRLAQVGAVFVADEESRSRHLGASTVMRREQEVKRHNWVFLANRVPTFRWLRKPTVRQWAVPYVEVVVEAGKASYEQVRATVDGFLRGSIADLRIAVVGPWSSLPEERRAPLDDPTVDLRLVHELYAHDGRVNLVESVPESPFPAPFRFVCPPGWVPAVDCLHRLVRLADDNGYGLVSLALAERGGSGTDGVVAARLERTAAFGRARLLAERGGGPDLEDLVEATFGTQWLDGETWGLLPMERAVEKPATKAAAKARQWKRRAQRWKRRTARLQAMLDRTPARRVRRVLGRAVRKALTVAGIRRSRRSRSRGGSRPG
ncbi:glycosyltransferase family 2 protein [Streptosporangium saharense]|uniref:glycosyltransferase family 2 protein n=1 Tax=Streptosporangium saharense TaxID=1706840 RepID=UPI0036B4C975